MRQSTINHHRPLTKSRLVFVSASKAPRLLCPARGGGRGFSGGVHLGMSGAEYVGMRVPGPLRVLCQEPASSLVSRTVLRDFAGLENMDEETTAARSPVFSNTGQQTAHVDPFSQAMLNFSYHLACGNTDEVPECCCQTCTVRLALAECCQMSALRMVT